MKTLRAYIVLTAGWLTTATALFGQHVIEFNPAAYTTGENAGTVLLTIRRSGDINSPVSVDYATANGTATAGVKYAATNGTVAFPAGETRQTISIALLNDALVGGTTTFKVFLSNPTGGAVLTTTTNATVTVLDPDKGITFRFVAYTFPEDVGAAVIGIARGDQGDQPMSVDVDTINGTATEGRDYEGFHQTVLLPADKRPYFFNIPILNNQIKDGNRTFRITMSNPADGTLGCTPNTTVTILDNDPGIEFESANYAVAEDGGSVLIGVRRGSDDTNLPVEVDYATSAVSALTGTDYANTTGTLAFGAGETVKSIAIPILNDGLKENAKSFRVNLSNPTGGAVLGSPTSTTVSILDNDPGIGFEKPLVSVWAGEGEITLAVLRGSDDPLGPLTLHFATADGTAKAGLDYEAISGTLEFQANEMVKGLTIPILRRAGASASSTFTVTLSNPSNGLGFGTATTSVRIDKNYCTISPPFASALAIREEAGAATLRWYGGGNLQRADRVRGPWQTLSSATSPWRVKAQGQASFYRATHPRPTTIYVPSSYDSATPMPLVFLFHGVPDSGQGVESYMQFRPLAESRGFLYCYPDATGFGAWNSTDVAHDPSADWGAPIADDPGWVRHLVAEIARRFTVDRKRIYMVGRSAGAHMAWRMGAQYPDLVAGISPHANAGFWDANLFIPSEPVNVLYLHSLLDDYWGYTHTICDGLLNFLPLPSAERTLRDWANYNGASNPVTDLEPTMDLINDVPGPDTLVTRYRDHPPGGAVELWTLTGGPHRPSLTPNYSSAIVDWLLAHPKP